MNDDTLLELNSDDEHCGEGDGRNHPADLAEDETRLAATPAAGTAVGDNAGQTVEQHHGNRATQSDPHQNGKHGPAIARAQCMQAAVTALRTA